MLNSKPEQRIRSFNIQLTADVSAMIFYRPIVNRELSPISLLDRPSAINFRMRRSEIVRSRSSGSMEVVFDEAIVIQQLKRNS